MKFVTKSIHFVIWAAFSAICALVLISASMYLYLSPALPDVQKLKDFKLQTPMRIMSSDNKLIAEYGEKRRAPLSYEQIPVQFVQALIAIEDKRFEFHHGVDPIRFTKVVLDTIITGDKEGPGGSTLTQQVARNYFLTQQKTFTRKFTEILLALKMESELSKQDIFELYINKHFLGYRSYGIQAAATVYYGKDINDLSLAQLAMIAGLHQAPSAANPIANKDRAKKRRNGVLAAMRSNNFITEAEYQKAASEPITAEFHGNNPDFEAYYLAEMVRSYMLETYGNNAYNDGYTVYTTVASTLQQAANDGLRRTLIDYSRRHGYIGPELPFSKAYPATLVTDADGQQTEVPVVFDSAIHLQERTELLENTPTFGGLLPALVIAADDKGLTVIIKGESVPVLLPITAPEDNQDTATIAWARKRITVDEVGPEVTNGADVALPGDIVRIEVTEHGPALAQVPRAQGAFVALSPQDGSIQALVGGFDYVLNKFNRAVQSERQPGSNFKPFVYSAALDKGYTPATIVNDAPIVKSDDLLEDVWRPKNSGDRYLGPIPLRQALYQSRNLSSIRVLDDIGVRYARDYVSRFGFEPSSLANDMTLILGSTAMSPLQVATGYAIFANGGYAVEPYFIARIEDKDGNILFEASPTVVCRGCPEAPSLFEAVDIENVTAIDIQPLELNIEDTPDSSQPQQQTVAARYATQVLSPQTAFLMDSILKDVVQRGTATAARRALNRSDLAGKTGTTNDAVDAWFTGYNGDYVASSWVGLDTNLSLGASEYGGKAALPAWIDFMKVALDNKPLNNLPQPVGIVQARIDPATGLLANPGFSGARFEYFREENVPTAFSTTSVNIDFTVDEAPEAAEEEAAAVESLF